MSKNLYDWSFFTAGDSSPDLLGLVARWGLTVGFRPKTKFLARALTDLQELTSRQAAAIDVGNTPGTANTRYWFKARILGAKSPHEFLPDPCDPAYADNLQFVYNLISMHTSFLVEKADEVTPVTRGDIVEVEVKFEKGQYQLQYGRFLRLDSIEDPADSLTAECGSLVKIFGKINHQPLPTRSSQPRVTSGPGHIGGTSYASADCNQFNLKSNSRKIPKFTLAELEQLRADGIFTDLLYVIHEGESGKRNYSAANLGLGAGTKHSDGTTTSQKTIVKNIPGDPSTDDLTKITIGRIKKAGKKCRSLTGRKCWDQYGNKKEPIIFAAGRYQIIPGTLLLLLGKNAKAMGIATPVYPNSQLFDEKTQDILAIIGLMARRPAIGLYLTGMMDQPCSAIMELAAEWASFPLPIDRGKCKKGQSYYCGGSDRAADGHTLGAIETILAATRARILASGAYASALSTGRVGPTGA